MKIVKIRRAWWAIGQRARATSGDPTQRLLLVLAVVAVGILLPLASRRGPSFVLLEWDTWQPMRHGAELRGAWSGSLHWSFFSTQSRYVAGQSQVRNTTWERPLYRVLAVVQASWSAVRLDASGVADSTWLVEHAKGFPLRWFVWGTTTPGGAWPAAEGARVWWTGLVVDLVFWGFLGRALVGRGFAMRDRRRLRRGACVACGYSLAGNTSGTCPECGNTPPPPPPPPEPSQVVPVVPSELVVPPRAEGGFKPWDRGGW